MNREDVCWTNRAIELNDWKEVSCGDLCGDFKSLEVKKEMLNLRLVLHGGAIVPRSMALENANKHDCGGDSIRIIDKTDKDKAWTFKQKRIPIPIFTPVPFSAPAFVPASA